MNLDLYTIYSIFGYQFSELYFALFCIFFFSGVAVWIFVIVKVVIWAFTPSKPSPAASAKGKDNALL